MKLTTDKNLAEALAEHVHDTWMQGRLADGWTLGEVRDDAKRTHPCLIPYEELSEEEKDYDRRTSQATLQFIIDQGFEINKK